MRWGPHGRWDLESARAKFYAKTIKLDNGCIEWTGALGSHKRYGILMLMGRQWLAHRAAWFLFRAEDPGDNCVCHTCDNGLCVNVDHLFLGSQTDNVRDMETKGRSFHPAGENHGRAKLSQDQVDEIRRLHASGDSIRSLARNFGVTKNSIARIVKGRGWLTT